jgi:hypothetical protein
MDSSQYQATGYGARLALLTPPVILVGFHGRGVFTTGVLTDRGGNAIIGCLFEHFHFVHALNLCQLCQLAHMIISHDLL